MSREEGVILLKVWWWLLCVWIFGFVCVMFVIVIFVFVDCELYVVVVGKGWFVFGDFINVFCVKVWVDWSGVLVVLVLFDKGGVEW